VFRVLFLICIAFFTTPLKAFKVCLVLFLMVRASLIWLIYNSFGFIDIALGFIGSVLNLDFDDYEVVIVDNASSDGSFEVIRRFVEKKKPGNVRVKFVRSDANRGYAGGMNLGWEARDGDSRYAAFLNNDIVIEPES